MSIPRSLNLLQEPITKQRFTLQSINGNEMLTLPDKRIFPLVDGIPVLLDSHEITHGIPDPLQEDIKRYFRDMWDERNNKGVKFWQDDGYTYSLCRDAALIHAGKLSGKSVLILGAGRGHEASVFNQAGAWTLTTDILVEGLRNHSIIGETAAMDAQKLYLADNSFDIVYAQSMLMFVDPLRVVSEIRRVLKTGGRFISVEPLSGGFLFRLLFALLNRFTNYDILTTSPPNYMTLEGLTTIGSRFHRTIYKQLMVFSPLYHLFRIAGMHELVRRYFSIETKMISNFPKLQRQCMFAVHVFEK
ncbi:MAG: methyltransferase domain-containing protein [Desulfamplus sp.]|nr:methyltransferase domain-containing protein [Desulfamplus sp.]